MKTAILCYLLSLSPIEQNAIRIALGQVESGGVDTKVGRAREVSRFQILPRVWTEVTGCTHSKAIRARASNSQSAWLVASQIINERADSFRKVMGRWPTPSETYGLWSRPSKMFSKIHLTYSLTHLSQRERDRCIRFQNLVEDSLKPKKP
jgi:hypothetical protein